MSALPDPIVSLPLSEIQRFRDALMRQREYAPMIRQLWTQFAALYERLRKQAEAATPPLATSEASHSHEHANASR